MEQSGRLIVPRASHSSFVHFQTLDSVGSVFVMEDQLNRGILNTLRLPDASDTGTVQVAPAAFGWFQSAASGRQKTFPSEKRCLHLVEELGRREGWIKGGVDKIGVINERKTHKVHSMLANG